MSERAHRDEVHARFGVGTNIAQINAPGALERYAALTAGNVLHGLAHVFDGHVIEQNGFGIVLQGFVQFSQAANLYFDRLFTSTIGMGAVQRFADAAGQGDVIVLDEDTVGEIEAVIQSASAAHGIFVEHPQTRDSLAGIQDARLGAGDGINEFASQCSNAAHALQEIQDDTFAGEEHARVVANDGDLLSFVQAHAIEYFRMAGDLRVRDDRAIEAGKDIEDDGDRTYAREDAILLGEDCADSTLVRIDAGVGGRIARRPVFEQRVLYNRR